MNIHYAYRPLSPADDSRYLNRFDLAHARAARNFHRSFPEYAPTPLWNLSAMAEKAGVASIHLKDESFRFGLDAFKVLGGSYCIARKIGELLDIPAEALSYKLLTSPAIRERPGLSPLSLQPMETTAGALPGPRRSWAAKALSICQREVLRNAWSISEKPAPRPASRT